MAETTENKYTGNGVTTDFPFTFPYIKQSDVIVSLNSEVTTAYSFHNATTIRMNSAPDGGENPVAVRIYRITDDSGLTSTFYPGSAIRSTDLNDNFTQNLFTTQEVVSRYLDKQGTIAWEGDMDAGGYQLTNAGKITSTQLEVGNDGLNVDGVTNLDETHISETLSVQGTATLQGFADLNNGLDVYGNTDLDNTVIGGSLQVSGSVHLNDTGATCLVVAGDIDANGALDVHGTSVVGGASTFNNNVTFTGANANVLWNKSDSSLEFQDNAESTFGAAKDLKIYHDGTNSFIYNDGSNITITAESLDNTTQASLILDDNGTFTLKAATTVSASSEYLRGGDNSVISFQHFLPEINSNLDLGSDSTGKQWNTAYINNLAGDCIVTTGDTSTSDTEVYSAKRSDELFLRQDTSELIKSNVSWSANDTQVATTAAIDERIIDLVDKVGGFVAIPNEASFPEANPDLENDTGTIVSITALSANRTASNSGVLTTGFTTTGSTAVTITGCGNDQVFNQSYGLLVQTTAVEHTYSFVRYVPSTSQVATVAANTDDIDKVAAIDNDVTKVAAIDGDVEKVAAIDGDVEKVAAIDGDVEKVAAIDGNVTIVANDTIDIGRVSTNIGSVAAVGSDLANSFNNISDYGSLDTTNDPVTSTSGTSDIQTVASNIDNVNTVAGDTTAINNITTNLTHVQNAATNAATATTQAGLAGDAKDDAETAKGLAETAKGLAETAKGEAETAKGLAETAKGEAETAKGLAETAKAAAELAETNAETAETNAETAQAASEAARDLAEDYKDLTVSTYSDTSGLYTQQQSISYNLADNVSTHTDWGDLSTTLGSFASETTDTLLTMATGSSTYNYGDLS